MPCATVNVTADIVTSPEAAWSIVSDFCGDWHPAIATIEEECGGHVRAFTVHGETTLYRERLTWRSDSDRTLGYTHLEGISGIKSYDAQIAVSGNASGGSTIDWSAEIEADRPRLDQVSDGTQPIFEAGIKAIAKTAGKRRSAALEQVSKPVVEVLDLMIEGSPAIAATVSQGGGDTLCLFLHGIGGGRSNWLPQLRAAGSCMKAAAIDLRGYGDSELGSEQSTVDDYCADILRVKNALGASKLVLAGLSYGSWIATSFAMRHADLLAGLVLSGGCTGMSEAGVEERENFRTSRQAPLDAGKTPADFAPDVVRILAGPNASDDVKALLTNSMAAIPAATYRDAVRCFTHPPERFDFSRMTMPVLMMTGQYDRLASPDEIRSVAQRIHAASPHPDVRFETIADAGHVCNVEQPEAYNRILLEFLRGLPV
jgi:pimeloyl-ACP methyl ester carboxylesterase